MEDVGIKKRRVLTKIFDSTLDDRTIGVTFPKFVTELEAVASAYGIWDVRELISTLQGMCLSEGLNPRWRAAREPEQRRDRVNEEKRLADNLRRRQAAQRLEEDHATKALTGDSFPERVMKTRQKLGDF